MSVYRLGLCEASKPGHESHLVPSVFPKMTSNCGLFLSSWEVKNNNNNNNKENPKAFKPGGSFETARRCLPVLRLALAGTSELVQETAKRVRLDQGRWRRYLNEMVASGGGAYSGVAEAHKLFSRHVHGLRPEEVTCTQLGLRGLQSFSLFNHVKSHYWILNLFLLETDGRIEVLISFYPVRLDFSSIYNLVNDFQLIRKLTSFPPTKHLPLQCSWIIRC